MVCNRLIFNELGNDPFLMLEQEPLKNLCAKAMLGAYKHHGFWQPMDTYQEFTILNSMWNKNIAPWKVWP